jgi:hypothetical protein
MNVPLEMYEYDVHIDAIDATGAGSPLLLSDERPPTKNYT